MKNSAEKTLVYCKISLGIELNDKFTECSWIISQFSDHFSKFPDLSHQPKLYKSHCGFMLPRKIDHNNQILNHEYVRTTLFNCGYTSWDQFVADCDEKQKYIKDAKKSEVEAEFENFVINNRFKYIDSYSSYNFYQDTLCGGFAEQISLKSKTLIVCRKCGDFVDDQCHGLARLTLNSFQIDGNSNISYGQHKPSHASHTSHHVHAPFPGRPMTISDYVTHRSSGSSRGISLAGPH